MLKMLFKEKITFGTGFPIRLNNLALKHKI